MIEQRCDHGFLRSVVPCSTCDAQRYQFQKGDAPGEGKRGLTSVGSRVAGILVLGVVDHTFITAQCGCGVTYRTHRSTVSGCAARGKTARCPDCIAAARTEAKHRRAQEKQLKRDTADQQNGREKQGVAA